MKDLIGGLCVVIGAGGGLVYILDIWRLRPPARFLIFVSSAGVFTYGIGLFVR